MNTESIIASGLSVGLCVFLLWLISIRLKDVSIADIWWGPGFAVIAWVTWAVQGAESIRFYATASLLSLWGLRLGGYLAKRNLGHEEDHRYQAMRGSSPHFWWTSLFKVFLFQGAIQLVVALPVFVIAALDAPFGFWDMIGISLALAGVVTEAMADRQLSRFKSAPDSAGQVMDKGLWAYSRHPNYFGNALMWFGIAWLAVAGGGAWWSLIGPALMLFLLLKVSGVSMLESTISERRPAYRRYKEEVSAFVPWPRKK